MKTISSRVLIELNFRKPFRTHTVFRKPNRLSASHDPGTPQFRETILLLRVIAWFIEIVERFV